MITKLLCAKITICVFMRHVNLVALHVIIASFMRHRQLLLFTLVRRIFHCTLSAPVTREIDSSVIGRCRVNKGERDKIMHWKTEEGGEGGEGVDGVKRRQWISWKIKFSMISVGSTCDEGHGRQGKTRERKASMDGVQGRVLIGVSVSVVLEAWSGTLEEAGDKCACTHVSIAKYWSAC